MANPSGPTRSAVSPSRLGCPPHPFRSTLGSRPCGSGDVGGEHVSAARRTPYHPYTQNPEDILTTPLEVRQLGERTLAYVDARRPPARPAPGNRAGDALHGCPPRPALDD